MIINSKFSNKAVITPLWDKELHVVTKQDPRYACKVAYVKCEEKKFDCLDQIARVHHKVNIVVVILNVLTDTRVSFHFSQKSLLQNWLNEKHNFGNVYEIMDFRKSNDFQNEENPQFALFRSINKEWNRNDWYQIPNELSVKVSLCYFVNVTNRMSFSIGLKFFEKIYYYLKGKCQLKKDS